MNDIGGGFYSAATTPFRTPQSQFSVTQVDPPGENSPESSIRNPFGLTHLHETLEEAFTRLNVGSTTANSTHHPPVPNLGLGGVDGVGGPGLLMGSSWRPMSSQYNENGNLGLELGHGWDGFTFDPYLTNGMRRSSSRSRQYSSNFDERFSINSSPFSQRGVTPYSNELFWDSFGAEHGRMDLYQNLDLSRSVVRNSHLQWLKEPTLNCLSLESVRGRVVHLARDQYGCRALQKKLEGLNREEEIGDIFHEVIEDICELVVDPFGNYVVQKLVELCSEEQRTQILLMLTKADFQLVGACLNMHGTRVVQKLLEHLTNKFQISIVTKSLSPCAVALAKSSNGHHVVQHCLKHFSQKDNEYLLNEMANHCIEIAMDKSGCCVLQLAVECSQGEVRERLLAEIIANSILLSEDRYGNYVVQHILGLRLPEVTKHLLRQLEGSYMLLSLNKFGSNVVERCLKESEEKQATKIIMELLTNPKFTMLLVDQFGNYVIQSALFVSKGLIRKTLLNLVELNSHMMRSNLYGRKILASLDKRKLQIQNI